MYRYMYENYYVYDAHTKYSVYMCLSKLCICANTRIKREIQQVRFIVSRFVTSRFSMLRGNTYVTQPHHLRFVRQSCFFVLCFDEVRFCCQQFLGQRFDLVLSLTIIQRI